MADRIERSAIESNALGTLTMAWGDWFDCSEQSGD